jgi:hypothetical protein
VSLGDTVVAYCFHSVEGFSKFGSYIGNGSATGDGPFVYTGFRPSFLLVKSATVTAGEWYLLDSARDTYNLTQKRLFPNRSYVESSDTTNGPVDFLSNGFKVRATSTNNNNYSGATYIYMAFADTPFPFATAH